MGDSRPAARPAPTSARGDHKPQANSQRQDGGNRLLFTLEQLLSIEDVNLSSALDKASDLIAPAIHADKIDAFLYDPSIETLVAVGTSRTPMGIRQRKIGMDRLPIVNGGAEVAVLQSGEPYLTGRADQDPTVLRGLVDGLGVRSLMAVPLEVGGERRGVLQACSSQRDAFSQEDLRFLQAAAHWVGTLAHRAELVERITQEAAVQARQVVAEELVTVLAHDLGNYLTPLKARLQLVERRARREGRERDITDLDEAGRALNRLQSLIADLLDVGRLDQGLFSVSRQPVDLVALMHETVDVMRTGRLNIRVVAPEEVVVEADPARIRQALENLVSNAIKHSPDGVPIEVEVVSEKRDTGEWASITVHDQGPGIPPELFPRLFTRFTRGRNSTGLGLGLYLARSIAEAHGGTLTADSKPGQGTTFRLSLPV